MVSYIDFHDAPQEIVLHVGCFCEVCKKPHALDMTKTEFSMMLRVTSGSTNQDGRLLIACDECYPFKYSSPPVSLKLG